MDLLDYFRLDEAGNANFAGIGARIGVNVARYVQLEGGLTYDFEQNLIIKLVALNRYPSPDNIIQFYFFLPWHFNPDHIWLSGIEP